ISFFFQAEDGIRDKLVTGVQTCALPISDYIVPSRRGVAKNDVIGPLLEHQGSQQPGSWGESNGGDRGVQCASRAAAVIRRPQLRSEERRVGKECRSGGGQVV